MRFYSLNILKIIVLSNNFLYKLYSPIRNYYLVNQFYSYF